MPASSTRLLPTLARWLRRAALPVAAAATLAACGGGDRVEPFKPSRIFIFGDEYSAIDTTTGAKYSVNVPNTSGSGAAYYCAQNALWVQYLVNEHYGKELDACPIGLASTPNAFLQAQPDWTTDNVISAINATSFASDDLVVVLVGVNDITGSALTDAQLEAKAQELGRRVRALADSGVHVLLVNVPKIEESPDFSSYGTRRALYNNGLRSLNGLGSNVDGRRVAFLQSDALITDLKDSNYNMGELCPSNTDSTPGACDSNAISGISSTSSYVWSWGAWLSPNTHSLLGSRAANQVDNNWE